MTRRSPAEFDQQKPDGDRRAVGRLDQPGVVVELRRQLRERTRCTTRPAAARDPVDAPPRSAPRPRAAPSALHRYRHGSRHDGCPRRHAGSPGNRSYRPTRRYREPTQIARSVAPRRVQSGSSVRSPTVMARIAGLTCSRLTVRWGAFEQIPDSCTGSSLSGSNGGTGRLDTPSSERRRYAI